MGTLQTIIGSATRTPRPARLSDDELTFRAITMGDMPRVREILERSTSRACDMTIGGIYMWIKYFHYRMAIINNTLFIKGESEFDVSSPAFSMPVGEMPLRDSVDLLRRYCDANNMKLRFSAIPDDCLEQFVGLGDWHVNELTDWADYLYDINDLATLTGKKYNKKRNHVNRFMADNPEARLVPLTEANIGAVRDAFTRWLAASDVNSDTAIEESEMTLDVLDNLDDYRFEGAALTNPDGRVMAFTLGETRGDTLVTHIEKMDHTEPGAGETVNKMFAEMMKAKHPELLYVNREEDVGDEGLRAAKLSYHPTTLIRKYDLVEC